MALGKSLAIFITHQFTVIIGRRSEAERSIK
jgi:hypothetical protein